MEEFPMISLDILGLARAHPHPSSTGVRGGPMPPSQWDGNGHCVVHSWHEGSQCIACRVLGSGLQVMKLSRSFDKTLETRPCCILSALCPVALLAIFDPSLKMGSLRELCMKDLSEASCHVRRHGYRQFAGLVI